MGNKYEIFLVVKKEIDKWNPYGLLPDAPDNEFDGESECIANQISYESSVCDIANVISKIFSDAFEPQYFSIDMCMDVAENIRGALDKVVLI